MALIGVSLIVASVIFFCFRPPAWLPGFFANLRQGRIAPPRTLALLTPPDDSTSEPAEDQRGQNGGLTKVDRDRATMPPPPIPTVKRPSAVPQIGVEEPAEAEQTTPKASATRPTDPVPSFSLSEDEPTPSPVAAKPPAAPANGSMGPPPPRLPTLTPIRMSGAAIRNSPIPNRRPAGSSSSPSSSLAPPPSASSSSSSSSSSLAPPPRNNAKPRRLAQPVTLTPGHSPLDWARLSSSPTSDLRGLPPSSPYLRVTPSMLRRQTGRRGTDAWSALGGRVYNISPYLPFHPGGEPELLRGAGRDGTRLFGEVHPWVNYETMLSACLVGILVDEDDKEGRMDEMD